jgi:hypothetical protein
MKRLTMRKIKEAMRLQTSGFSIQKTAASLGVGQSAARTGLTKDRTGSHAQQFRNSLQTERHPPKKVRRQSYSLRLHWATSNLARLFRASFCRYENL